MTLPEGLVRALDRWNARHPWSHNDHFHPWILAHLPAHRGRALDVGCGEGALLIALTDRFEQVVGLDASPAMREAASARCAGLPAVRIGDERWEEAEGPFDLVTMVAVLHHLPLEASLLRVRELLAPGGRFLVVGLARPSTRGDLLWEAASVLTNPLIGAMKQPRPVAHPPQPAYPVAEHRETLAEVRAAAARVLPGAQIRRHLAFRYTLSWEKPA